MFALIRFYLIASYFKCSVINSSSRRHHGYFGTCDSFLWRMIRSRHTPCTSLIDQAALESEIEIFPATGKNENFQLCTKDKLAVGRGKQNHIDKHRTKILDEKFNADDSLGLCIDQSLMIGFSRPCSTFMNPCLASDFSKDGSFEIANIEVWALTPCKTIGEAQQMESFTRM